MKTLNYLLILMFSFLIASFQLKDELDMTDANSDIDTDWELSYAPITKEFVNTGSQSIEIDFTTDETISEAISYRGSYYRDNNQIFEGDLFDTFYTFDKLAGYYGRNQFIYKLSYSSLSNSCSGEIVYPSIEYALAQECFRDDCPTDTRKEVLRMALYKHERKISEFFLTTSASRRTGMFLMAVILVKEEDAAFLTSVGENQCIQNTLSLKLDTESQLNLLGSMETDSIVCQLAENFLSKK